MRGGRPGLSNPLKLSLREAIELSHNYIGTEHILLGLVAEGEGVAAQVLVVLGVDLSRVRQQVIQLLSASWADDEVVPSTTTWSPRVHSRLARATS